ncbi:hypothetical protein [Paraburkholderia oxyphila]|uniref:hypothetical protein n=1 Tax=Paraburkholderia oxyphila TaxID=614212 RepID=UPI000694AA5A|nr:hypothetical protein [Paraburkholderia oxyphila]
MWNTLSVPLENGWQCTLIPGPQYYDLMCWGRGYRNMSARQLYPNAGRDNASRSWNARPLSEVDKSELWEKDRLRQLADDRAAFARHFRPRWDLHTITGDDNLRHVQRFRSATLDVVHWEQPTDNESVERMLCEAVASGRLVPVVNHEYRGLPRVSQPTPGPQHWPATSGGGGYGYAPKVLNASEFDALRRANGELPPLDSGSGVVSATLDPRPALSTPVTADDGFGMLGAVASAASALLGDNDSGDDDDVFSTDYGGDSTPLGDAQPFEYIPDTLSDDVTELVARGVSEAEEAECDAIYDAEMMACSAAGAIYRDPRTYALCKQRAFQNYQTCRGYS